MKMRKEKGVVILELIAADLSDPRQMSMVLEKLLLEEGERKIVTDLRQIDSICSIQIGTLVTMYVLCYENVAVMKLAGANDKIKNILRMIGLETMMEMHHGVEVAAQSFGATLTPSVKLWRARPSDPRVRL
ncbi:MAG: hypothetical protein V1899_11370 [Planctomycetota bacterium]